MGCFATEENTEDDNPPIGINYSRRRFKMKSVTRYFRNAVAASMQGTVNYKKERFFVVTEGELLSGKLSEENNFNIWKKEYDAESDNDEEKLKINQRIIAGNAQFTGIAAGRGVGFTTGLLLLRKGLGMRETPIRPHSWHCRMQSGYQYGGNRKRPPVWRRHRGSLRPRGRNLGGVEGMTGGCGSGCDPAIHTRRLRVYHRPRRLRMASRISIFFAARRFEPLNSMG